MKEVTDMADLNNMFEEPENCTHNCGTCGSNCGDNQGKFWEALDDFAEIPSEALLKALQSFGEDEE